MMHPFQISLSYYISRGSNVFVLLTLLILRSITGEAGRLAFVQIQVEAYILTLSELHVS